MVRLIRLPLLLALLLAGLASAANESIALVVKASGEAVKVASDKSESPLNTGMRLNDGDRLRTGADGRVVLIFTDDKSQLKLVPDTRIVLKGNRQGRAVEKEVEMELGTLWTRVSRGNTGLRIATPTSVASVKGTAWWTKVFEGGRTEVITEEGIVNLLSKESGEDVDVGLGQTGSSDPNGAEVGPTDTEDLEGLERGTLKTITIPLEEDGQRRTLTIEYYE